MKSEEGQKFWDYVNKKSTIPLSGSSKYESNFLRITTLRVGLQITFLILSILLPWYQLSRPERSDLILVGAMELEPQSITILMIILIISIIEVLWLIIFRWDKIKASAIFDSINIFICFIFINLIANPTFRPGLGGMYSDSITLMVLNFAGFQIMPMIGYFFLIAALLTIIVGLVIFFFFL
ncbi:MAG: hypothetical protein ACFFAE_12535 [Candidatus Hodarchaeota archaeon]